MKKFGIFVGIDGYEKQATPLRCAVSDAHSLAGFFQYRANYTTRVLKDPTSVELTDCLDETCENLAEGDVLLFYFAGHGYQRGETQLLLCKDARINSIQNGGQVGAVVLGEVLAATARPGVGRLVLLDACRSPLEPGKRGGNDMTAIQATGLDQLITRDGQARRRPGATVATGGLGVVLSCAMREQALELPKLGRGLFTAALEDVLKDSCDEGLPCYLDSSLQRAVQERMVVLARAEGYAWTQASEWRISGELPVILTGRTTPSGLDPLVVPLTDRRPKVKCPACGRRNNEDDTFECRVCGKDHLCASHWEDASRCCEDCARMELDRKTAAAIAEQEQRRREKEAAEIRAAEAEVAAKQEEAKRQAAEKQQRERREQEAKATEEYRRIEQEAALRQVRLDREKAKQTEKQRREKQATEGFALIPAGEFQMGDSLDGDSDAPIHNVSVSAFYMARHEVTKMLWNEVRNWGLQHGYTDLTAGEGKAAEHPVQMVSWYDAVKWCNARSEWEGLTPCYTVSGAVYRTGEKDAVECDWSANGYRLPTEAEWEKAARGGLHGKRFPWGDTICHNQANFCNEGKEAYQSGTSGHHPKFQDQMPYTSPTGSFAANGYGLYDMSGNVSEWCWNWCESYAIKAQIDPRGAASSGSIRVYRGGSWYDSAFYCRVAIRYYDYTGINYDYMGFRPARSSIP